MSFFSDQVLNKRGPLGKVWLASHLERKLSKSVLLQTDIPNSVTAILGSGNDVVPVMALRLSGQLLLGVARIYSRKAKYLQDDCSEALVKIKLAFRTVPGANGLNSSGTGRGRGQRGDVDMTEEEAGRANINLNLGGDMRGGDDFDMLYNAEFGGFGIWDEFNLNPIAIPTANKKDKAGRSTVANQADITLREDHDLDYDRTLDLNFGGEEGIGSQEYRAMSAEAELRDDFELGLDLDLELDLGLMGDDNPAGYDDVAQDAEDDEGNTRQRRESPAAFAARQSKSKSNVSNRVVSITQARETSEAPSEGNLSEVPSVELGRHAATPMSERHSELLAGGHEGQDDSLFKNQEDTFDMDLRAPDFAPAGDNTTFDFGGNDYDTSLPQLEDGQQTPRATSPVAGATDGRQTTAETLGNDEDASDADETQTRIDMTPNTAAKVADAAGLASAQRKRKEAVEGAEVRAKRSKVRKQIVDIVIELAERGRGLNGRDSQSQSNTGANLASKEQRMAQGLLKEPQYLPSTTMEMRFEEIYNNPGKYFFAGMSGFASSSKNAAVNKAFYAGPPGLPSELRALFQFRVDDDGHVLGAKRIPDVTVEDLDQSAQDRRKRARSSVVPDAELGRERQPSLAAGVDTLDFGDDDNHLDDHYGAGDDSHDFSLGLGDFQPGEDMYEGELEREKTPSRLGSVQATPSPLAIDRSLQLDLDGIDRANASLLAVFDETPATKEKVAMTPAGIKSATSKNGYLSIPGTRQSGLSEEHSQLEESIRSGSAAAARGETGGWSRNTVKALKILEHELGPEPSAGEEPVAGSSKSVSFDGLSEKASRKAAASMFFEMLILGTRDCIKLKQSEAYGDVKITSKDNLWTVCDQLNKLTVDVNDSQNVDRLSRSPTPNLASSDNGETPTKGGGSHRDTTPLVASASSRRTAQMSM